MTPDQFKIIRVSPGINWRSFYSIGVVNGGDKTLLYGYDCDRRTWHVYQQGGLLHRVIYFGSNPGFEDTLVEESMDARTLVPNKRLYPEACDALFCFALKALDISLPFTTYGSMRTDPSKQFIGRTM